jgi:transposase-like protein
MATGQRRSAELKRAIVEEYESSAWGSKGAVLRRHRVTQSAIRRWMSYRDAGVLDTGLRKGWQVRMTPRAESAEIGRLRAEVNRLNAELERSRRDRVVAEAAAEALGKASALLQVMLQSADRPSSAGSSPRV